MKWFFAFVALVVIGVLVFLTRRQSTLENTATLPQPQPKLIDSESIAANDHSDNFKTELPGHNIEVSQAVISSATVSHYDTFKGTLPEDSTLRRHFLSNQEAERLAITHPYPTDSTLCRHYLGHLWGILAQSDDVEVRHATLQSSVTENPDRAINVAAVVTYNQAKMPEDATLRRHFLTQAQSEVAALLAPRPTDSTLIRHYDSLFNTKLKEYLTQYVL
ncbi:hypothetical protein [Methylomonas sp. AM2-LC]|uniref:hypothetical protein n=1 Tax=Methylomonas sp. AM2-LC TaxID=3153301 RepID=UPI0032645299